MQDLKLLSTARTTNAPSHAGRSWDAGVTTKKAMSAEREDPGNSSAELLVREPEISQHGVGPSQSEAVTRGLRPLYK
ncbi:UNVERIFIED_CONTAM: hypothetical protein K2H54_071034 [Gekko kuhli]